MKASLKQAIAQIEQAGFGYIKAEFEAQFDREEENECYECHGNGNSTCEYCDGEGAVEVEEYVGQGYHNNWVECDECYGDGSRECSECEGSGESGTSYAGDNACERFMLNHMAQAVYGKSINQLESETGHSGFKALGFLTYGEFYRDGSVDSEYTVTVPIKEVDKLIVAMNAFKALEGEIGNGMDVSGAGMHITVIPTFSNGVYPVRNGYLDSDKLNNFTTEVTKLLPALFFLGSANHQSRDLGYRMPQIDNDEKYSAIYTHGGTCFEYRLFETCYDKPETFYDFVEVIANTLRYYSDQTAKVPSLNKQFFFSDGDECARFFNSTEALRVLNAQVKYLKPKSKTIKKLKEERGVFYTIKGLVRSEKQKAVQLREDYREYVKHYRQVVQRPLDPNEEYQVDHYMSREDMSRDQAIAYVRGERTPLLSLTDFINRNLHGNSYRLRELTV